MWHNRRQDAMYKLFKRTHSPGSFEVQLAGACDPGMARDHNEDAIAIHRDEAQTYYLGLVCDGMGGHNAGEIASALAVETITQTISEKLDPAGDVEAVLREAFALANRRIDDHGDLNPDAKGMGCTAVGVLGIRQRIYVVHAGDSRAYRLRGGQLMPLTADHTLVQEMLDNGLITAEQAAVHPYRGRISRCLGHGKNRSEPTINQFELERGDNVLLCSDGLSDVVDETEIAALIGQRDVRDACRRLIEAANKGGGPDNISALIIRRVV